MSRKNALRLGGALVLGFSVSGCEVTGVGFGVSYGYNDPFYWNDYYYRRDVDIDVTVPDRPDRPERPDRPTRPPTAKPPVAKPPSVRPPTHKPARPSRPSGGGGRLR